jgi:hypothetical protein
MNQPEIQTALNDQHTKILQRIQNEVPTQKWLLQAKSYGSVVLCLLLIVLSSVLFTWFVNNLLVNRVLLRPSLLDVSGVEWVWSPELLGLGLVLYFAGISLQKSLNSISFKLAGLGAVAAFAVFINIALFTPTTLAFQSTIQPDFNKLGYRVFSRDNHVKVLMEHGTYYGVVVSQINDSIEINHGGIIKSFKIKSSTPNLTGKPVQIEFENQDNLPFIKSISDLT